jgi:hypothetical protein
MRKQLCVESSLSAGAASDAMQSSEDERHEKPTQQIVADTTGAFVVTPSSPGCADGSSSSNGTAQPPPSHQQTDSSGVATMTTMSAETVARIRNSNPKSCDETGSVASEASSTYSWVRMTLLPLYVSEVKDSWPESGRCRKAVSIDEALQVMQSRPEFYMALTEVKEKGLHLVKEGGTA